MRDTRRAKIRRLAFATSASLTINSLMLYVLLAPTGERLPEERSAVELTLLRSPPQAQVQSPPPMTQTPGSALAADASAAARPEPPVASVASADAVVSPQGATSADQSVPYSPAMQWPGCPGRDLDQMSARERRECERQRIALERLTPQPPISAPTALERAFAKVLEDRAVRRETLGSSRGTAFGCPFSNIAGCEPPPFR